MSAKLQAFLKDWSARVRSGEVSSLDRTEVIVLELYDDWLQKQPDWKEPVPELEGTHPVVLYFRSDRDRAEFIEVIKEVHPGMVTRNL